MKIPMKLTAIWENAVGDKREVDMRQRLYAHELLKQTESVEALRCMYNEAMHLPRVNQPFWFIHYAAVIRTFWDHPNRRGELGQIMMKLNFNMGGE